jgi:hypothetical protein
MLLLSLVLPLLLIYAVVWCQSTAEEGFALIASRCELEFIVRHAVLTTRSDKKEYSVGQNFFFENCTDPIKAQ